MLLPATDPLREWSRLFSKVSESFAAMDAYRNGDVVTLQLDLPGVDSESIDVQIERGELRIAATRQNSLPEGARYFIRERAETKISRRIVLGDALDVENVVAQYDAGVLTLHIPLHEAAKPHRVKVQIDKPVHVAIDA